MFWYHYKKNFDSKMNLIKEIIFDPNGKMEEETITYNYDGGNLVEEKHFKNGNPTFSIKYEYNANNLLAQSISKVNNNGAFYETIKTNYYTKRQ